MNRCIQSICIAATIFCAAALTAEAATEKRGVIDTDERWTADKSPYMLTDDVLVTKKARLYIGPGVTILAGRPHSYEQGIRQIDQLDSFTVAIRVEGTITCAGRRENRITFAGSRGDSIQCEWYGLVLDGVLGDESEIAFVDIAGSCNGLYVRKGSPIVHHCIFEYNNIGITISDASRIKIVNCAIAFNVTAGVRITMANPVMYNNLIVSNRLNGVWSDGASQITFENNLVFGNTAGDLSGCDPDLGMKVKINEKKDSVDAKGNLFRNPVFYGTEAESLAMEHDNKISPRKSRVKDTVLAKSLYGSVADSLPFARPAANAFIRYKLSGYSPCVNAGMKGKAFNDVDGSRNDIGVYGGPEFYQIE
jgi:hypothetical protein